MPKVSDWRITGHNIPKHAAISTEDADLATRYTWTYTRKHFYNGYVGCLHRVVMARMIGENLRSDQVVIPIDGNYANCTRDNLELLSRKQWRLKQSKARQVKKLGTQLIQQMNGYWRVVKDNTLHETEDAAIAHLAQLRPPIKP